MTPARRLSRLPRTVLSTAGLLAGLASWGCAPKPLQTPCLAPRMKEYDLAAKAPHLDAKAPAYDLRKDVLFRYLGAGGVYLEWQGSGVVTAPLFTHYTKSQASSGKVDPDTDAIAAGLADVDRERVQAIFVGSGRWDRMADLVEVAKHLPSADIFLSKSAAHMLAPYVTDLEKNSTQKKDRRIRAVDGTTNPRLASQWAWMRSSSGEGLPIRVRALPLESPEAGGAEQDLDVTWDEIKLADFEEGQRYAYVIDFFDDERKKREYRVLIADAGAGLDASKTSNEEEESSWDDGAFDVIVIGVRALAEDERKARALIQRTGAEHAVLIDYEGYRGGGLTTNPTLEPEKIGKAVCAAHQALPRSMMHDNRPPERKGLDSLGDQNWTMPLPGEWIVFPTGVPEPEKPAESKAEGEEAAEGEKGEKGEKDDKGEKGEKDEKGEKAEKAEKGEKAEKPKPKAKKKPKDDEEVVEIEE